MNLFHISVLILLLGWDYVVLFRMSQGWPYDEILGVIMVVVFIAVTLHFRKLSRSSES